jgi:hypothetical protein
MAEVSVFLGVEANRSKLALQTHEESDFPAR